MCIFYPVLKILFLEIITQAGLQRRYHLTSGINTSGCVMNSKSSMHSVLMAGYPFDIAVSPFLETGPPSAVSDFN
jgi:hypothetical protein